jgi:hypothetical protein
VWYYVREGEDMFKKFLWVMAGLAFLIAASTQLFTFTHLLLGHEISICEYDECINRLEFSLALLIFFVAIFVFGYFVRKALR